MYPTLITELMTRGQPTLDSLRCPRFIKSSHLLCMTRSGTDSYSPLKCVFITYITSSPHSGPSLFMVLSREDAVSGWRALMGPTNPEEAKQQNPNS